VPCCQKYTPTDCFFDDSAHWVSNPHRNTNQIACLRCLFIFASFVFKQYHNGESEIKERQNRLQGNSEDVQLLKGDEVNMLYYFLLCFYKR